MRFIKAGIVFVILLMSVGAGIIWRSPVEKSFRECEKYHGVAHTVSSLRDTNSFVILVSKQAELKSLSASIRRAINDGEKNIQVLFMQGVYYYDRLPIYLYNIDAKDVSINIIGNNAILVAGGKDYQNGSSIPFVNYNNVYLGANLDLIEPFGEVIQSIGPIEILDLEKKECRLSISQKCMFKPGMVIQVSEWFHSPIYKVTKVQKGYVYFVADDLTYDEGKKCYNVHYDNVVAKSNPRFRIYEPQKITSKSGNIHECEVSVFLTLYQMRIKQFSMSGIIFRGCAKGKEALCYFRDVDAEEISINDCSFEYMNQRIVKVNKTANLIFENNTVSNCYFGAVYSYIDSPNTIIQNNYFYRNERGWTNSSCVTCYGEDFMIANNLFVDNGYSAIVSGFNHNWGNRMVSRGVIENNEICFGDEYYAHPEKYTLFDGGAIYIGTLSNRVIVRYNYIHHFQGIGSVRGIYCDDGAMNVKIYGNVICGAINSHAILSWRAKSVNQKIPQSNDGIDVYYNVIWGKYKFDERSNSTCIHGNNLVLYAKNELPPETILVNFAYQEKDIIMQGVQMEGRRIVLTSNGLKELKKLPTYPKIKQWFYETTVLQ